MATNPMQRRARNSFLLGILITTLILGLVIGGLAFFMMQMDKDLKTAQAATIYVLKKDLDVDDEITFSDLSPVKVNATAKPQNSVTSESFSQAYAETASTENEGETTGKKFRTKIALKRGTAVTTDMLYFEGTENDSDIRKQEYNSIVLPMDLTTGEYVDIRFLLPTGQDYIVVSKKKVEIPLINNVESTDTVCMELSESEILEMSNAIVEAYMINGSKLYATKYTDPDRQAAATPTYPVNQDVRVLMNSDPNIVKEAMAGLSARLNAEGSKRLRDENITTQINSQDNATENEQTKMQESITNSQTKREEYLQSLNGGSTTTTTP